MKMRDLETRTGVSRETIRVYLRHGLVPAPARPARNVADYDDSHVRTILAVRDLQRDSGLTLRQIAGVLSGQHTQRRIEAGAFQNLEALVASRVGIDDQLVMIAALQASVPFAAHDAQVMQTIGLVDIIDTTSGAALSLTDARLVGIWGEMRTHGFTEENGFPPNILTFYVEPAETIAAQEASIFLDRTEGKIDEDAAAAMLQKALPAMLDFFGLLRVKAFLRHIHRDG